MCFQNAEPNTLYKLSDSFGRCYIFLVLPDISSKTFFIIGRYLTSPLSPEEFLELATKLLKTTSLQIGTIAQHCGFFDVNYFSRTFKKYTGKAPKDFRVS